jgi:hypothetical protein
MTELLVYDMRRRHATEARDAILAPLALAIIYLDIKAHWPDLVEEHGSTIVIRHSNKEGSPGDLSTASLVPALFELGQTVPGLFMTFTMLILKLSASLNILSHVDDRLEALHSHHSWVPNFAQGCGDSLIDYGRYLAAGHLGDSNLSFRRDEKTGQ